MDEQMAKDVETVKRAAGRQAGRMVQGDIVTHADPLDPDLESAKAFVSGLHSGPAEDPQPNIGMEAEWPSVPEEGRQPNWQIPHPFVNNRATPNHCTTCGNVAAAQPHVLWENSRATREEKPASYSTSTYDAVNPPHYQRGPVIEGDVGEAVTRGIGKWRYAIKCIDVMRAMKDPRLATAFKYIWRVAFGGKCEPGMEQATQRQRDTRDIESAVWYLQDWLNHEV